MASFTYTLRNSKSDLAPIYVRFKHNSLDTKIKTGFTPTIKREDWSEEIQIFKNVA